MVKPEVTTVRRMCIACRKQFDAQEVKVGGRVAFRDAYCPACSADEDAQPTAEDQESRILEELDALDVNVRRHGRLELEDLGESPAVNAAKKFVQQTFAAGRWREVRGLYLWGPTGTGKSQIAVSCIRAFLVGGIPRKSIVYDRGRALITQLQDRYGTNRVDEFSKTRQRARVWVYDDAGTERLTDNAFRVVEDILDRREGNPTLITSNLTRQMMATRWNEIEGWARLRSRLGPYDAIEVEGADRRFGETAA